jgi:hypothetical protein
MAYVMFEVIGEPYMIALDMIITASPFTEAAEAAWLERHGLLACSISTIVLIAK